MDFYPVETSLLGVLSGGLVTLHVPFDVLDRHFLGRGDDGLVGSGLRHSRDSNR